MNRRLYSSLYAPLKVKSARPGYRYRYNKFEGGDTEYEPQAWNGWFE